MSKTACVAMCVAILGSASTGCAPMGYRHARYPGNAGLAAARLFVDVALVANAEEQRAASQEAEERAAVDDAEAAPVWTPSYVGFASSASPRDVVTIETRVPFDSSKAKSALDAIDVGACKDRGAPAGYGHARVTFGNDGAATKVEIDAPSGLTKDAVACFGERLGAATVPPFDGGPIAVGTSYLVK